ncbi:MAG: M20 family metallopeptidase [Terriglobia bacterium]
MNPRLLLDYCKSKLDAMLRDLRRAVEIESPSDSKPAVDRMAAFFADECRRLGGLVELSSHQSAGAALTAEFWSAHHPAKPLLILGHTDTVWSLGTLPQMPFRVQNGRAYGPGILDMKAGIVCGLWAIRAMRQAGIQPGSPVRLFLNSDEERGSTAFRSRIMAEARRARACLVLEPAAQGGALKTARKGVGVFQLVAEGRMAHAGINPAAGVNAISELAHQLVHLEKLARSSSSLTLNVGVIEGGTRPNVVPERAAARVDVRVATVRDGERITRQLRGLKPVLPGAKLRISGGINRQPMERRMAQVLFEHARQLGVQLGMKLKEASTGGGSDGNFSAALGIPTLDGLGAVGDGAHARHEYVTVRDLPRRAALLAALLATI